MSEFETPDLGEGMDDDASAFFTNLTGEEIKKVAPEAPEDDAEAPEAPTESAEPEAPASTDPDDTELEWGDEGSKTKASMKALKAAYADRAATTLAAAETATERSKAATVAAQASTALNALVAKAEAKWSPFAKLDFLALSKDPAISSEDFTALRAAAQEALTDYRYLTTELEGTQKAASEAQRSAHAAAQQACVTELTNPTTGIEGFNQELYGKLVEHATGTYGAPRDAVLAITAPWALKVLNDAMLYRKGVQAASEKVQKVVNKATKVLRPGGSANGGDPTTKAQAMKALRSSGSVDDAEAAFLASFGA